MDRKPWHRFYDDGVPVDLQLEDATVVDFLARAAERYENRPALLFLNSRLTYAELQDQVDRLATALDALGVEQGERIAIQVPNLPQTVIAYYAALKLGAVPVPTNPLFTAREIEHQWNDAGATVAVLADFIYDQKVRAIRDRLQIRHYIIASVPEYLRFPLNLLAPLKLKKQDPPLIAKVKQSKDVHFFRKLINSAPPTPPKVTLAMDAVATLLYTGGTTGVPKAAMLTHRNISANVQQLAAVLPSAREGNEVILGALPFFHSYGMSVVMNFAIRFASAIVLMPNPRDIPQLIRNVEKFKITLAPMVPAHFQAICQFPGIERRDLSSMRICNSGSAPLSVEVFQQFEKLTGSKVCEGFGLTESSPVTHSNPVTKKRKVGSIGIPLPLTDSKIVDIETGARELPPGEVGELAIAGPQVMEGYWNRADETAQVLRDGWLYTGDLCRVDEDGFHFIEGRKKDMIICSGYNVYPDEVDRVLMSHEAVLEAATIGLPDEKRGETVKSFVVLKSGLQASTNTLVTHCRAALAPYKVPRAIEFRDALPKSSVLKILRRELKAEEIAKQQNKATPSSGYPQT